MTLRPVGGAVSQQHAVLLAKYAAFIVRISEGGTLGQIASAIERDNADIRSFLCEVAGIEKVSAYTWRLVASHLRFADVCDEESAS